MHKPEVYDHGRDLHSFIILFWETQNGNPNFVQTQTRASCSLCVYCRPERLHSREADTKAVRETDAAKMRAWASKDADKIAVFFADDATHFSPNMPALKGRQSIRETFKERLADPNRTVSAEATSIEVSRGGDLAYVIGVYTATSTDPKTKKVMAEKGRYVTVYKKQADGSWKGVVNIDNR